MSTGDRRGWSGWSCVPPGESYRRLVSSRLVGGFNKRDGRPSDRVSVDRTRR